MPRQEINLVNGEIYHICYRAVGDADIFKNDDDRYRGIFSLYEFNNAKPTEIWLRRRQRKTEKKKLVGSPSSQASDVVPNRDKLVEILAFCFMPNHMHLLLRQVKDEGITKFMQKVGGGYAYYFNRKYQRKGHLFNQFKAIHVGSDEQLRNSVTYIHCNPISLIEPNWKENGIVDAQQLNSYLGKEYRWSSLWDYQGKENFPSVTERGLLGELIGLNAMEQDFQDWISYKASLSEPQTNESQFPTE